MNKITVIHNQFLSASIHPSGCSLFRLKTADGFSPLLSSREPAVAYGGTIVGPCCGRIAHGFVDIENRRILLSKNENGHHLHGGYFSTAHRSWKLFERSETSALYRIAVEDSVDGYPGNRIFQARYILQGLSLIVEIQVESDQLTVVNPTHHAYWNLNGEPCSTVMNHRFKIPSILYYPTDDDLLPQSPLSVSQTSFDFSSSRTLIDALEMNHPSHQLKIAHGFNHGWNTSSLFCEGNRAGLQVTSDSDDIWLYSGGFLDDSVVLEDGSGAFPSCAFAVEPQNIRCPTLLYPGEIFKRRIIFELKL